MRAVLLGATRGMGRALARELAKEGAQLFLLGRDAKELSRSARDLEIHGARGEVGTAHCDLLDVESFAPALASADRALGGFDTIVVTAGVFATQAQLEADPALRRSMLAANFANTIELCEQARALLAGGRGTLCVFSSVAGDRGRKPVVLYGATKAGLSCYLEALDHAEWSRGLRVICVKPGFVHTSMTAGLPAPPFAGSPEAVARRVARALRRPRAEVYAPAIWRWIMLAIRRLPRAVMRRVAF